MKTNIVTTKDQSQRLLRCGVSAESADMMWSRLDKTRDHNLYAVPWYTPRLPNRKITDNDFPAWSLSAWLGLIPHVIEVYDDGDYYFSLAQEFPASEDYHAAYMYCWADDDVLVGKRSSCPIEACVQLIEWLKENGYKLNEI